ncbi:hypothetical protein OG245_00705 [Streptomyces sp. NBC_01116]
MASCSALGSAPSPRRATELRRRLVLRSVRIEWHPFWSTPAGWTPAARLRRWARVGVPVGRVIGAAG